MICCCCFSYIYKYNEEDRVGFVRFRIVCRCSSFDIVFLYKNIHVTSKNPPALHIQSHSGIVFFFLKKLPHDIYYICDTVCIGGHFVDPPKSIKKPTKEEKEEIDDLIIPFMHSLLLFSKYYYQTFFGMFFVCIDLIMSLMFFFFASIHDCHWPPLICHSFQWTHPSLIVSFPFYLLYLLQMTLETELNRCKWRFKVSLRMFTFQFFRCIFYKII